MIHLIINSIQKNDAFNKKNDTCNTKTSRMSMYFVNAYAWQMMLLGANLKVSGMLFRCAGVYFSIHLDCTIGLTCSNAHMESPNRTMANNIYIYITIGVPILKEYPRSNILLWCSVEALRSGVNRVCVWLNKLIKVIKPAVVMPQSSWNWWEWDKLEKLEERLDKLEATWISFASSNVNLWLF